MTKMTALTRRAALASTLALAACASGKSAAIPFEEADPHIVFKGKIGGRPLLALLDNGAPITSVDRAFAKAAALPASPGYVSLSPTTIAFGVDAALPIHPILEDLTEAALAADLPIRAIVGQELFDAFIVGLAFAPNLMTLSPRGRFDVPRAATPLPLIPAASGAPYVEIIVGQRRLRALLDLGCAAPLLISADIARALRLGQGRTASTRQTVITGADGLTLSASTLTSIDGVGFAGRVFDDMPIDILPAAAGPFTGFDAVVGLPLLRKFDLTLDLPRRAWIAPTARLTQPFIRRYTGLQTRPVTAGLLVRHVGPGSPAATAGFRAGEVISAINGAPPLMRTLREARAGQRLDIAVIGGPPRNLTSARYY